MQKILDLTQDSLAESFAAVARSARRQRYLYFATICTLVAIVVVSVVLVAVLATARYLDYRHGRVVQYATDVSALLEREGSFMHRAEVTVRYYDTLVAPRPLPAGAADQVRETGIGRGFGRLPEAHFDVLVPPATRDAWGSTLDGRLSRLYEAADSILATQLAFDLDHRAYLVGVDESYGLILPALDAARPGKASALDVSLATRLHDVLTRELQSKTGRATPAPGERVWIGPYVDPVQNIEVMTEVTAVYENDTAGTLIAASVPVKTFLAGLTRLADPGTLLLQNEGGRLVASSPAVTAEQSSRLLRAANSVAPGHVVYSREGVLFVEPTQPGFGSLVYFVSYAGLLRALSEQLMVIAGLALVLIAGVMLTARFWGLRLLRQSQAETERALESETINHILVSATPVGLCIVRQRDYSLLTFNQLAASLLRPGSESKLPPHIVTAFREHGGHEVPASSFAKIAGFIVHAKLPEAGGPAPQFLQITYAPARYDGEDVLFCAVIDVTEQQTLEQQLRSAQQASEAMMRARSNFFASMSHEIRTPLNALLGNLELLSRSPGVRPHEQRLRALGMAADGLRRIVNDILDFSKIDAGELKLVAETFRPIDDMESLALSYAPMAQDRPLRFYVHLSATLDTVLRGDRTRIAQIVNNLLNNAFKFTACGKITFSAEMQVDVQERDVLVCRVCDSGIGMDAVLVSRIFSPFVQAEATTSSRFGGTGLGLSICARLCELMGGHITVESVPGVGSAFTVMIPLASLHAAADEHPPAPVQRGTTLVLCQERDSGKYLETWMLRAGWLTNTVLTQATAEAFLRANTPSFMIVTGEYDRATIDALRAVRRVPVVWMTRTGHHSAVRHAEGVYEVNAFNHRSGLATIERAVGESSGEVEAAPEYPVEVEAPDAALQGLVILVAEDNPLNQTLVAEQLDTLGCRPIIVGDGRQALAALQNTEVDAVLTDIHMPVMDGHELLARLHVSHPDVPVLAFSAVTSNEQAEDWRERGFAAYVAKPASLKELETALLGLVRSGAIVAASAATPEEPPAPVSAPRVDDTSAASSAMSTSEKSRYMAILKDHLATDLPKLAGIIENQDVVLLRQWAHGSAGAFLVVQEPVLAKRCRELEQLCGTTSGWTPDLQQRADALHAALSEQFNIHGDAVS
ncbi:ATP-binding protein [Paraburkholderia sartisoli]|uniref:Virulence sensor protein BvgS n=1 Tax=Paraburkholderia sartisoli TaxID=83784 RepID=A0A1H4GLQ8_9BURK|nr:ATP-binding protein [Paraburkholderia sartisoli]SEB10251.1 two-component system, NarL family, capsular synthesis sensor histidine kinase RcsC [Paraburkholderia sartisoli]